MNPLPALARALGTQPWVMKLAKVVVWVDHRLHRVFRGRVSLVGIAGLPSLRLTATGRKSGLPRSHNLLYFPYRDGFVLVGSNWGRPQNPAWTINLRANPEATIEVRGKEIPVRATLVEGEGYDELWRRVVKFWPGYEMERVAAGRELPIFLLTPETATRNVDE
ncbi:nitroreductase [Amycolatopsis taiwanensis]|uniref:Nitroreductase n=2 Tax=Amycolatopsis taiwanensis TaxID=342230 RepID=A0A9W6R159_9PSEU|nr:nitroreductase [Amycolatopsis taiwanensis]